jgi:metallo-beta-lactamase family protein
MSSRDLSLAFHGAAKTVTGSCMEFGYAGTRVLVDCGLFQGSRTLEHLNLEPFAFDPERIDAVIVTHAHIDHSGLLPRLVAEGFTGPVWCTRPTSDLLEHMLADSGRIQEYEADRRNRRRDRAGDEPFEPLYTAEDAMRAWELCRIVDLEELFEPAAGFRARLWNAGHILGSASVELEAGGVSVLCSGDIGPDNKAFHRDPDGRSGFDHVICEGTYGDRPREKVSIEDRRRLLQAEVEAALIRGGNLLIPAFALERTQELLLDLGQLLRDRAIPDVQVFLDSPLAIRATGVFSRHAEELEDTGPGDVFDHPSFHFVSDATDSIRLNKVSGAIIIAASGMCEGGRIRHHLIHNLHRRDSTVLFVGFQAQGSLGRVIQDGAQMVRISGNDVRVRAQVRSIDTYSAHADQTELLEWIRQRSPINGTLFLDHGEPDALEAMRREMQRRQPALNVRLPEIGEVFHLPPGDAAIRTATGRPGLADTIGRDWQNDYAAFVTSLRQQLGALESDQERRRAIERMRGVLETYKAHRQQRGRTSRAPRKGK